MSGFSFNFAGNTTTGTNLLTTPAPNTFSFPNSATSTTSSLKLGTNTLGGTTTSSNLLNLSSTPAQTQSSSTGILSSSNTTLTGVQTLNTTTTSTITFKTLEEHINTWMNDLDTQEKEFLDQACQLNALDRLMIDNGEKVFKLEE
jgi:hypothetical protein